MLKLYIAKYEDSMYPEDNYTLGTYWSDEDAEKHINARVAAERATWLNYPCKHSTMQMYYSVEELNLEVPPELADLIRNLYKIAKTARIGDMVKDDELLNITGLSPWCLNEGTATKDSKVDLYKMKNVMTRYGIDLYP